MEHPSILKDKLSQHEFEYRAGAWENMEAMLDASPVPTSKPSFSSKWFKILGVAATVGVLAYFGFNNRDTQSEVKEQVAPTFTQPIMEEKQETKTPEQTKATKPMSSPSPVVSEKKTPTIRTEKNIPTEYSAPASSQNTKNHQIAEPVDDSKVYRENKNHKNPNHITDEHSKAPAASDLHSNND